MGWVEVLLPYRAADDHLTFHGAVLLAHDPQLLRMAATWSRVERVLPPEPGPGEEINLNEVWKATIIDFPTWADMARVSPLYVILGFTVLKSNRVIFPDGSLSHQAESFLQKEAAGSFMNKLGIKPGDLK